MQMRVKLQKLRERWEEERVMSLESKLDGGGSQMMGPDRGVPSQLRSRADDQALLIATLLANHFHSNPIPQLSFHLVIEY
jgi:hypothetical protein